MQILFVAAEMTPLAKVGGLGDVIGALPQSLRRKGVNVSVVLPRYEHIPKKNLTRVRILEKGVTLYRTKVGTVPVFLIDAPPLNHGSIYFEKTALAGKESERDRFVFFSEQVFALIAQGVFRPDIVHCHDWHSGLLVKLLSNSQLPITNYQLPRTVFTIHNLVNQGKWGDENFMRDGITHADMVTTVSPTYAKEILTKEYGEGLEGLLRSRARAKTLVGILNGIDYTFWNPKRDSFLSTPLKDDIAAFKFENKAALVRVLKLRSVEAPLVGIVARLTHQKGIDLIQGALNIMSEEFDAQFVVLGQGEERFESFLRDEAARHPERIFFRLGFDERLAHRIYAASDFFLMPSRFEPSGLGQMISMRYGTIPIVRHTGGLADSVTPHRTGFVFKDASASAVEHALREALTFATSSPRIFDAMRARVIKTDFSFDHAAKDYVKLYKKVLAR